MLFFQKCASLFFLTSLVLNSAVITSNVESIDVNLRDQEIAFTFFSLSNGEATLLQHPNGENILINTGSNSSEKELDHWLKLYGVKNISTILVTKDDPGFVGNLQHVINQYKARQVIVSNRLYEQLKGNPSFPKDVAIQWWDEGTKLELNPEVDLEVLYNGMGPNEGMDFVITFISHKFLFMSSFGSNSEENLLKKDLKDVNIVKMADYGGPQSMTKRLAKHLDPQVAILFNLDTITPSEYIFELLEEMWIDVYLTKEHGTITIKCTDETYEIIHIDPKGKQ
ncbi:hypothetical protein GCM10008967_42740 [Bacillus carboniphilus]|uniref:Hydrolase n=1 Tax=Bacillus carboniphilus TaxID=86663 RepID=A0ABP3GNT7_9BACI